MDALETIITTYPIPTLLAIAAVVLLGGRMRAQNTRTTLRQVAVVLACYLFAFGVVSWADGESARMWLLVGVLVVIAVAMVARIVQARSQRPTH